MQITSSTDSSNLLDKIERWAKVRPQGFRKFESDGIYLENHSKQSLIDNYLKYFNRNVAEYGDGYAADWDSDDFMYILYNDGTIRELSPSVDEGNKKVKLDGINSIILDGGWGTAFAGPCIAFEDYTFYPDIPDIRVTFNT